MNGESGLYFTGGNNNREVHQDLIQFALLQLTVNMKC